MNAAFFLASVYILATACQGHAQENCSYQIGKLKYDGGGDWYANPSSLPNIIEFINEKVGLNICSDPAVVEARSVSLNSHPIIYATGHGNIYFSEAEALRIRNYVISGGFIIFDDNYGMFKYIQREINKVFPEYKLNQIPNNHPIFSSIYKFDKGLPKIHQHDGQPARLYGISINGRLSVVVTQESDLGDGWEDASVHSDPESVRQQALEMGANIVAYALCQYSN